MGDNVAVRHHQYHPNQHPFHGQLQHQALQQQCTSYPHVIWRRRQHLSHRKRTLKKQLLLEHMRGQMGRLGRLEQLGRADGRPWEPHQQPRGMGEGRRPCSTEVKMRGGTE